MADTKVDGILIDIEASSDAARGNLSKIKTSLDGLKTASEGINKDKLEAVKEFVNGLKGVQGDNLKGAGDGIKSIASSVNSLSKIDTAKLKDIADTVAKIGAALGNLGNNNRINIKIDGTGEVQQSFEKAETAADKAKDSAKDLQSQLSDAQNTDLIKVDDDLSDIKKLSDAVNEIARERDIKINTSNANQKIAAIIEKINAFKKDLASMENGKTPFDAIKYEEMINGLQRAQMSFNNFKESIKDTPKTMTDVSKSIDAIGQAVQKTGMTNFAGILRSVSQILPSLRMGSLEASTGFQQMAVSLESVQTAIPIIGLILTVLSAVVNKIREINAKIKETVQKAVSTIKDGINKIRNVLRQIRNFISKLFSDFKDGLGIQEHSLTNLENKLRTMSRLLTMMVLRKMFTKLFENMGASFNLLAQYSDRMGTSFNKNISLLVADFQWLSNSVMAAFEPLINAITPIIDAIINKLVEAINVINQFFAAITGASVWTRAKKVVGNYADSLDNASGSAKKLKKAVDDATTSIDELNIIKQDDDDNGSGGGASELDPTDYFTTEDVPNQFTDIADWLKYMWDKLDFSDLGRLLAQKLADMLAKIPWDAIKKALRGIARSIATFLNGFFGAEIDGVGIGRIIGENIAEAINTAFAMIDEFLTTFDFVTFATFLTDLIKGTLENLDWGLIFKTASDAAKGLVDFLNTIFNDDTLWSDIGASIANGINTVITFVNDFINGNEETGNAGFDFYSFGESISTAISDTLTGIDWTSLGHIFGGGFNGLVETIQGYLDNFKSIEIALDIAGMITTALKDIKWGKVKKAAADTGKRLGEFLWTLLDNLPWEDMGRALVNGAESILDLLYNFFDDFDPAEAADNIATMINSGIDECNPSDDAAKISEVAVKILDFLNLAIAKIDKGELLAKVAEFFEGLDWENIVGGIASLIGQVFVFKKLFKFVTFGEIAGNVILGLINGFIDANHLLVEFIEKKVSDAWEWFKGLLGISSPSTIAEEIGEFIVEGFLNGIKTFTNIKDTILEWANSVFEWFTGGEGGDNIIERFGKTALDIIDGFKENITSYFTTTRDGIVEWAGKVVSWFTGGEEGESIVDKFLNTAHDIVENFKSGVAETYTTVSETVIEWGNKVVEWFTGGEGGENIVDRFVGIAKNIIDGFVGGLKDKWNECKETVEGWADSVAGWVMDKLGIESPSKVFYGFGQNTVAGFNNAVDDKKGDTDKIVGQWTETLSKAFGDGLNETEFKKSAEKAIASLNSVIQTNTGITGSLMMSYANKAKEAFTSSSYGGFNGETFAGYAYAVVTAFNEEMLLRSEETATTITDWGNKTRLWFTDSAYGRVNANTFRNFAIDIINAFANAISQKHNIADKQMSAWGRSTVTAFSSVANYDVFYSMGRKLGEGLEAGIRSKIEDVKKAARALAEAAASASKAALDIHSPSRVFYGIGENVVDGFNNAIEKEGKSTKNIIDQWSNSFADISPKLRLNVDTSGYTNNYGADFKDATYTQRLEREISLNSSFEANVRDGFREALSEIIEDKLSPVMNDIAADTKRQADKSEQINVQVGSRVITETVDEQRRADGYRFN